MKRLSGPVAIMIAILFIFTFNASSQISGSLDQNFGSGGMLMPNVPGATNAAVRKIAIQSNGGLIALFDTDASDQIGRFKPGEGLDLSFGNGGFVNVSWPAALGSSAKNIVVQSDGKIVVSGFAPLGRNASAMRFQRYNADGSVDNSFGVGGVAAVETTGGDALVLQPDGRIIAMGADGKLVRLNSNGSLDQSFGSRGIASPKLALRPWANGLLILPSGRIIATGYTVTSNTYRFTVAGYNSNGSLDDGSRNDTTPGDRFGSNGSVVVSFPGYTGGRGFDVKLNSNGQIIVLGLAGTQNSTVGIARMTVTGQMDTNFGNGGRIVFTDPNGAPQGTALGIQADGRVVVIGGYYMGTSQNGDPLRDAMVVRFSAAGELESFDVGQFVQTDISGGDEFASDGAVYVDPNCQCERILWSGGIYAQQGRNRTPLMLQYVP